MAGSKTESAKEAYLILMYKLLLIKLASVLVNILTCLIVAIIILFIQDWFGKGDIYAFIFWTVPFALIVAIVGKPLLNLFRKTKTLVRILLTAITTGILSVGWAYCVALLLGPWMGAFSIPVLYLWMAGCFVQLLFLNWQLK
jgi:hypothetical protein